MQKYALENGELLVGQIALIDTMKDLIIDTVGALCISAIGYISLKHKNGWLDGLQIKHYISDNVWKGGEESGDFTGAGYHGVCDCWHDWYDKGNKSLQQQRQVNQFIMDERSEENELDKYLHGAACYGMCAWWNSRVDMADKTLP